MPKQKFLTPWRLLTAISVIALSALATYAQDNVIHERMKKDVFFLASPECEGRGIDTKGIHVAADYIINNIKQAGLKPAGKDGSYFQPFNYNKGGGGMGQAKGTQSLVLKGPLGQSVEMKANSDFKMLPNSGSGKADTPLVFVGYGVSAEKEGYDDFKGIDVKGKIVVVLRRVPRWDNAANAFLGDKEKFAGLERKIEACIANKAAAVIVVNDRSEVDPKDATKSDMFIATAGGTAASIPVLQLRRGVLDMMLVSGKGLKLTEIEADIDRDLKPRSGAISGWSATVNTSVTQPTGLVLKNVVGVLEGSGPLANQTIVVGAHYDHLGYGLGMGGGGKGGKGIFPGADDNGSGSTTIMELARRFGAIPNRQGRRLVFIWFSGEESGLLGSKAYVANPIFPLDKTVAMVNLDMVGRLKDGPNPELYAEGFDTGKGMNELLKDLNKDFGFKIVGPHKQQIYGRSDQASFYNKGVPGVFFFTDFHPDYHKQGDTPDKINVAGMAKVAGLAEKLIAHLLTVQEPPAYVAGAIKGKGGMGAPKQQPAKLGLTPDATNKGDHVLVAAVTANGPAAKAGIKEGDRITAINGTPTPNNTAYLSLLQGLKAGAVVQVSVLRGMEKLELKVTTE